MQNPKASAFPAEFQAEQYLKLDEAALVQLLKDPGSTVFQKNIACRRLALIGTKQAVPALAAMLTDEKTAHYARYALKPIPDPAVDDALRAAVPKLKGKLLAGVLDTIGHRQDPKAVDAVAKLVAAPDSEIGFAAAASLGQIGGNSAAKALLDLLPKTKAPMRTAVADATLVCAEALIAQGDRKQAMALYDTLSRPEMPRTVRNAAMHSIIAAQHKL